VHCSDHHTQGNGHQDHHGHAFKQKQNTMRNIMSFATIAHLVQQACMLGSGEVGGLTTSD